MPRAGQRLMTLDRPAVVEDFQNDAYEINSTGDWGAGSLVVSGTYNDCAVTFTAPTSGTVECDFAGFLGKGGTGVSTVRVTPEVREGSTVGSGTVVHGPDFQRDIAATADGTGDNSSDNLSLSNSFLLSGLVAGQVYNARLLHRGSSGTNGLIKGRRLTVRPSA